MMKRFTSMIIALLLLVQLVLSPITFAQTGEQEENVPETPEMEVCILPWDDYKIFSNYRLNYQAAVADEDPVFAQDLFESMQDVLVEHCDAAASIIQVQTDGLDATCNDIAGLLFAKNNFYVTALDADNATAVQGLIQTVLLEQSCDPILAPDSEVAIDLIQEDIAAQQTIDLATEVIPYASNVCFNTYGPSHTFKQQVENIQEATVATSMLDAVSIYADQLSSIAIDAVQEYREGALLSFARTLLGFKKSSLQYMDYRNQGIPFQVDEFMQFVSSITTADGLEAVSSLFVDYLPSAGDYLGQLSQLDVRTSLAEPRIQNLVNSLVDTPIVLVRDEDTQVFISQELQEDDRGLSFVFPELTQEVVDPQDPANTIQETIRASMELKILDIQGSGVMVEEQNTDTGELEMVEEYSLTKIVAEVYYADEKVFAMDIDLQYNEAMQVVAFQEEVYIDPYIITADGTITRESDTAGHEVQTLDTDIRFFGPGGCDVLLEAIFTDRSDAQGEAIQDQAFTLTLNNTRLELEFTDTEKMFDDISLHRQSVPTATSAPTTENHVVKADIYFKPIQNPSRQAYLYPENDSWSIGFPEATGWSPRSFIPVYRDPAIASNPIDLGIFTTIRDVVQEMRGKGDPVVVDEAPVLTDLSYCIDVQGATADGYYYYATDDVMVSSYCLPSYDTCGVYQYNVDSLDLYYRQSGIDASCVNLENETPDVLGCTDNTANNYDKKATSDDGSCSYDAGYGSGDQDPEGGSGYEEIPGCTNPAGTNYNSGANIDDGSCVLPPPGPIYGCTNPEAINYNSGANMDDGSCDEGGSGYEEIPGCTNPEATNYNSGANFDNGTCTFPQAGPVYGCMDEWARNYNPDADIHDDNLCEW